VLGVVVSVDSIVLVDVAVLACVVNKDDKTVDVATVDVSVS
jgi:hypothetical protein